LNRYLGYIIALLGAVLVIAGAISLSSTRSKESLLGTSGSALPAQKKSSSKMTETEAALSVSSNRIKHVNVFCNKNLTRELESINSKLSIVAADLSTLCAAFKQPPAKNQSGRVASQQEKLERLEGQLTIVLTDIASLKKNMRDDSSDLAKVESRLEAGYRDHANQLQAQRSILKQLENQAVAIASQTQAISGKLERHLNNHAGSKSHHPTPSDNCAEVQDSIDLRFDSNSADLSLAAQAKLDAIVPYFCRCRDLQLRVEGHTDAIGSEAYNLILSWQRIQTVSDYLIKRGLSANRLFRDSLGEFKPMASNATPEGRALNRRVTLFVVRTGAGYD
jgi:outer membrane protein OmpA-like peptidoglycan-associated protein